MGIPSAVKKQGEESERLAQEHLNSNSSGRKNDPPPSGTPDDPPPTGQENWEKRFKNLKKTHDTTVSSLRSEIADLKKQLEKAAKATPETQTPAATSNGVTADDIMEAMTEQEREDYSPEFIQMMARIASRMGGSGEIADRVNRIERRLQESDEERFWREINEAVPNWKQLQSTEDMQGWLLEYDDLLGMSRSDAIAQAQERFDSARVIAIFKQYQPQAPANINDTPEGELTLPGGAGGDGGEDRNAGKRTFKVSEINRFYNEVALKNPKWQGKEGRAAADQLDKEIMEAQKQGRVIEG